MMGAPHPFILIQDQDGRRHALRRQAVTAMVEDPIGTTTLLLGGGRVLVLDQDLETALALLS